MPCEDHRCYESPRYFEVNFFITRPVFSAAIALLMVLAGGVSMLALPISQYPPLVPTQIQISTRYIGADADVVDKTVTTPVEEVLNGGFDSRKCYRLRPVGGEIREISVEGSH